MHCLEFLDDRVERSLALSGTYDPILVTLSILVASLAAYAALGVAERIGSSEEPASKRPWFASWRGSNGSWRLGHAFCRDAGVQAPG